MYCGPRLFKNVWTTAHWSERLSWELHYTIAVHSIWTVPWNYDSRDCCFFHVKHFHGRKYVLNRLEMSANWAWLTVSAFVSTLTFFIKKAFRYGGTSLPASQLVLISNDSCSISRFLSTQQDRVFQGFSTPHALFYTQQRHHQGIFEESLSVMVLWDTHNVTAMMK